MKNIPIFHILCVALVIACNSIDVDPEEEEVDEFKWLKFINIDPGSDTLVLIEEYEDRTLAASGTFIETKEDTVIVKGLFTEEFEATTTYDTTNRTITNNKLEWISSDNSVVRVSAAGVVSPVQGGAANVRATVRGISSNLVPVKVVGLPFLQLDPPAALVVTLPDSAEITGRVGLGALLSINDNPVDYDPAGRFSYFIQAGAIGTIPVIVSATDKNYPQAVRVLVKSVNFILPNSPTLEIEGPEAQAIFLSEGSVTTTIRGVVEVGALLYIDGTEVQYDQQGNFSETVSLTALGNKVVTVRAVNSLFPQVFTEKTKTYTVYPADDVIGNWSGAVDDGSTFQLTVVEDPANPGNYIFSGLYNWRVVPFLNVVIVDVPFTGTLDAEGGIRGTFAASQDGAEADVVYMGSLSTPNDASGTVHYVGSYPPYDLDRVNNWTAAKE